MNLHARCWVQNWVFAGWDYTNLIKNKQTLDHYWLVQLGKRRPVIFSIVVWSNEGFQSPLIPNPIRLEIYRSGTDYC